MILLATLRVGLFSMPMWPMGLLFNTYRTCSFSCLMASVHGCPSRTINQGPPRIRAITYATLSHGGLDQGGSHLDTMVEI
ncbi:hypothetical protein BDW71DRAFT_117660 [Aspergillus fruticulosus]